MVREAASHDAEQIAALSALLGRTDDIRSISEQLRLLGGAPLDIVIVDEAMPGVLSGWIHGSERVVLGTGRRCEIIGLVVDTHARGVGTGRRLVEALEAWARERDLERIVVRSNAMRDGAHAFYPRLGYEMSKTQHVYRKALT